MPREDAENFREETARMQHIQAVQSEQSLIATKRQRAEQRRIFSFIAHQRTTCAWVFAGADKDRISLRTAGSNVAGCSTFAPKVAISAASANAISSMRFAAETTRGSVV